MKTTTTPSTTPKSRNQWIVKNVDMAVIRTSLLRWQSFKRKRNNNNNNSSTTELVFQLAALQWNLRSCFLLDITHGLLLNSADEALDLITHLKKECIKLSDLAVITIDRDNIFIANLVSLGQRLRATSSSSSNTSNPLFVNAMTGRAIMDDKDTIQDIYSAFNTVLDVMTTLHEKNRVIELKFSNKNLRPTVAGWLLGYPVLYYGSTSGCFASVPLKLFTVCVTLVEPLNNNQEQEKKQHVLYQFTCPLEVIGTSTSVLDHLVHDTQHRVLSHNPSWEIDIQTSVIKLQHGIAL